MSETLSAEDFEVLVDSSEFMVEEAEDVLVPKINCGPPKKKWKSSLNACEDDINICEGSELDAILGKEKPVAQILIEEDEEAELRRKSPIEIPEAELLPASSVSVSREEMERLHAYLATQPLKLRQPYFRAFSAAKKIVRGSDPLTTEIGIEQMPDVHQDQDDSVNFDPVRKHDTTRENEKPTRTTFFQRNALTARPIVSYADVDSSELEKALDPRVTSKKSSVFSRLS